MRNKGNVNSRVRTEVGRRGTKAWKALWEREQTNQTDCNGGSQVEGLHAGVQKYFNHCQIKLLQRKACFQSAQSLAWCLLAHIHCFTYSFKYGIFFFFFFFMALTSSVHIHYLSDKDFSHNNKVLKLSLSFISEFLVSSLIWPRRKSNTDGALLSPSSAQINALWGNSLYTVKSPRDLCCHHLSSSFHLNTWHCLSAYHRSRPTRPLINMRLGNCDPVVGKAKCRQHCAVTWADVSKQEQGHTVHSLNTLLFFVILLRDGDLILRG